MEFLRQPAGATHMIGVQVSRDDVCDRTTSHWAVEDLLPQVAGRVCAEPGIDDDPATVILQQPEVYVLQGHWQGHSQPQQAIGHRHRFAVSGLIVKLVAYAVHGRMVHRLAQYRKSRSPGGGNIRGCSNTAWRFNV